MLDGEAAIANEALDDRQNGTALEKRELYVSVSGGRRLKSMAASNALTAPPPQ
jgi:hypothetical protein